MQSIQVTINLPNGTECEVPAEQVYDDAWETQIGDIIKRTKDNADETFWPTGTQWSSLVIVIVNISEN